MRKRNCCKQSTVWRKPRRGIGEGTQGPDTAADPGRCDFGKGDAGGTGDGVVRPRNLSLAKAVTILFCTLEGLRGTGGFPFFVPEGRTYSPPAKQAVVSLPLVRLVRSSRTVFGQFSRGGRQCRKRHRLCSRLYVLLHHQNSCFRFGNNPPPACENLPPAAFTQLWVSLLLRHPFSFCEKETKIKAKGR